MQASMHYQGLKPYTTISNKSHLFNQQQIQLLKNLAQLNKVKKVQPP